MLSNATTTTHDCAALESRPCANRSAGAWPIAAHISTSRISTRACAPHSDMTSRYCGRCTITAGPVISKFCRRDSSNVSANSVAPASNISLRALDAMTAMTTCAFIHLSISFLSFAIAETGLIYPHTGELRESGYAVKQQLVRAALRGCDEIWKIDPGARVLHTDPIVHIE